LEVSGEVRCLDGASASGFVTSRLWGGYRFLIRLVGLALLLIASAAVAYSAGHLSALESASAAPQVSFIAFISFIIAFTYYVELRSDINIKCWRRRGSLNNDVITFRIEPDGLMVGSSTSANRLGWGGISEISRDGPYWVIFGNGLGYILPRRLFSTVEAEETFVAACLEKLDPEARARSLGFPPPPQPAKPRPRRLRGWITVALWAGLVIGALSLGIWSKPGTRPHQHTYVAGIHKRWAALSVSNNRFTGTAWGYPSQAGAISSAQAWCTQQTDAVNCRPRASVYEGCLALAVSTAENITIVSKGAQEADVQREALALCRQAGGGHCWIQQQFCSYDPG